MKAPRHKDGHWSRIGSVPASGVVQHRLDDPDEGFGPIRGLFRPTGRRARHIWCERCCSPHEVVSDVDRLIAVSRNEDGLCADIQIESGDELEIWELDLQRLGELVVEALGLRPMEAAERERGIMGRDGRYDRPLVFVGARSEARRISDLQQYQREHLGGVVVLLATRTQYGPNVRHIAEALGVGVLVGEDVLEWEDDCLRLVEGGEERLYGTFSGRRTGERAIEHQGVHEVEFEYKQAGTSCTVIFEGSTQFHVRNTDGAKYVDWLLHHHGRTVTALELEQIIKPEKAGVRDAEGDRDGNSSHKIVLARRLRKLTQDRASLEGTGRDVEEQELTHEIDELTQKIHDLDQIKDSGEKARNNVRKAITRFIDGLSSMERSQREFGAYLRRNISLGYTVVFTDERGDVWN